MVCLLEMLRDREPDMFQCKMQRVTGASVVFFVGRMSWRGSCVPSFVRCTSAFKQKQQSEYIVSCQSRAVSVLIIALGPGWDWVTAWGQESLGTEDKMEQESERRTFTSMVEEKKHWTLSDRSTPEQNGVISYLICLLPLSCFPLSIRNWMGMIHCDNWGKQHG